MHDEAAILKNLTETERLQFQTEMASRRKDGSSGVVLALLLGGIGAHHFYLGKIGLGIVYVCFIWTFVPAILGVLECFAMPARVRKHNATAAQEIVITIISLRSDPLPIS